MFVYSYHLCKLFSDITMADLINLGMHTKKLLKDQATPYKIALLVLIEEYCKTLAQPPISDEVINFSHYLLLLLA